MNNHTKSKAISFINSISKTFKFLQCPMINNRKHLQNIFSKPMDDLFIINHNHKITQSISQYEQSQQKDDNVQPLQQNNFYVIDLHQYTTNNTELSKEGRSGNRSTKRKLKRSQRYLKEKGNKQDNRKSQQIQHERYFSAITKKRPQIIPNQQISKTIQQQIQKTKNPRLIQIAMRYGMYNDKPRNNFYLSIKKRAKITCPTPKHEQAQSMTQHQSAIMPRKRSLTKDPYYINQNKVSLGTLNIDTNQDKSVSLMLDRKKITKTSKDQSSQNAKIDMGILQRNKLMMQVPWTKNNKTHRKIQFFLHDNFDIELSNIKDKISYNNYNHDSTNKTQCIKITNKKMNKPVPKQFKNVSQQIHIPLKIQSNQHSSFASIINNNNKKSTREITLKPQAEKTQIIPASIIFKKDKNKNVNMIDKITKSIQIQNKKDVYLQFQSKNADKKQKEIKNDLPTQNLSIVQRPKTHKDSRIQTDVNVLRKSRRQLFSAKPSDYTFVFDSKDHPYIFQSLVRNGWNQFYATKLNNIHTLKWVNNPVTSDILNMKEGQFYNHFHKSFELTSKSFLNTNLKANRHFLITHQFFPDTYDIGNETERQEFIQKYKYNVMMELLQKFMTHCFKNYNNPDYIKISIDDMQLLSEHEDYLKRTQEQRKLQNQFFNAMEFENYKQPDNKFKLNIFLVTLALKYYQKQRRKYDMDFKEKKHNFLLFNRQEFDKNYDMLELYSQQEDVGQSATQLGTYLCYPKGLYSYNYATPSDLLLKLLIKEYCFFSKLHNWKCPIESSKNNVSNIWIVKPSSNARGNGIYLQKNMNSMLKSAKDIQSRIVQKYIERPLLFSNTKYSYLNNHKFDLRQWVLLKSLDPLEIYMFSHFYLRLASQKYQTKDIENNKVHLTNFSANKQFFKSNQHSIVNSEDFLMFLKQEYSVDWQIQIKPKVKDIIVKSIQSCQQKLQTPVNGTCFELLGYDILIDQNFTPWLIEVNMSPACEQRSQWLSEYLKNMNQGLLEIVIPQSYFKNKPDNVQRKQNWQQIYYEEYHFVGKDYDPKLQVTSKEYQQKQRLNRQAQQTKSKSSLSNSMSPTKFKRKSTNNSLVIGESVKKLRKQCMSGLDGAMRESGTDEINETKMEDHNESFVGFDLVDDDINRNYSEDDNNIEQGHLEGGKGDNFEKREEEMNQSVVEEEQINHVIVQEEQINHTIVEEEQLNHVIVSERQIDSTQYIKEFSEQESQ